MLQISNQVSLPLDEIEISAIRAQGAGGQNVNKVSTAVELRFDVAHSPGLDAATKHRLAVLAGSRLTSDGVLVIHAPVGSVPEGSREALYRELLEASYLSTSDAAFAIDAASQRIVVRALRRSHEDPEAQHPEALRQRLADEIRDLLERAVLVVSGIVLECRREDRFR